MFNSIAIYFVQKDNYKSTGCFNLDCPGFVPASGAVPFPGQAIAPPSTYDGDDRYITISLHTVCLFTAIVS